jgi:hypothetical protein
MPPLSQNRKKQPRQPKFKRKLKKRRLVLTRKFKTKNRLRLSDSNSLKNRKK